MTDMSMISAQIDELRELAGDGSMEWVTGPIRSSVLRDAADTIWQLRDDLQRTNAENAKLREDLEFERSENGWAREFLNRMGQKCGTKDCPSLVAYVTKLEAENAKLRELVRELYEYRQLYFKTGIYPTDHGVTERRMRELGVEL